MWLCICCRSLLTTYITVVVVCNQHRTRLSPSLKNNKKRRERESLVGFDHMMDMFSISNRSHLLCAIHHNNDLPADQLDQLVFDVTVHSNKLLL